MDAEAHKPVVEVETTITAPSDKIWRALTSTRSPMFIGATMETDWRPGSPYTLHGEWQGRAFTDYGVIETATPGRELSFTHWAKTPDPPESYNAVKLSLSPQGGETKVTLAQYARGKPLSFDDKTKAEFRRNWSMMLDGLKKAAEN